MSKEQKFHVSNHSPYKSGANGTGQKILDEPVPNYASLPGSTIINGNTNNNASIIIARDRDPFGDGPSRRVEKLSKDENQSSLVSGHSDYMRAGAIDIVVGRAAPYPMDFSGIERPMALLPLYTTKIDPKIKGMPIINNLGQEDNHPGSVMDASRIYISQMCFVDEYFKIHDHNNMSIEKTACSSIVVKSDKVRLHARRDVKIVAGGDADKSGKTIDSQGHEIKTKGAGIHLMAGNGTFLNDAEQLATQQYIPLGDNLVECLITMTKRIGEVAENVNLFINQQEALNTVMANSIRVSPAGGSACDPPSQIANALSVMATVVNKMNTHFTKMHNLPSVENNYLSIYGKKFILSKYNTTN